MFLQSVPHRDSAWIDSSFHFPLPFLLVNFLQAEADCRLNKTLWKQVSTFQRYTKKLEPNLPV